MKKLHLMLTLSAVAGLPSLAYAIGSDDEEAASAGGASTRPAGAAASAPSEQPSSRSASGPSQPSSFLRGLLSSPSEWSSLG